MVGQQHRQPDQATTHQELTLSGELVRHYGEAMLRVGQLEAQVERLTEQLRGTAMPEEPRNLASLAAKAEPLQDLGAGSTEAPSAAPSNGGSTPDESGNAVEDGREDELRQLRVQISNLSGQLARTTDELDHLKGRLVRRRNTKERGLPWWSRLTGRNVSD